MNNTFKTLLEIKTAKNDISMKAIYIKDNSKKWKYFIYYYDKQTNSYYINWIKSKMNTKVLQKIINEAFKQEKSNEDLNSFDDIIKQLLMHKKPNIFYFYSSKNAQFINIEKIAIDVIRNPNLEIVELKVWERKSYS